MSEKPSLLDRTFEVSVTLKGLDGILELIGGAALLVMSPEEVGRLFAWIANSGIVGSHELILHYVQELNNYVAGGKFFAAVYLLLHGLVKVVLVVAVLKKQLWAYPVMIAFLIIFIVYQGYLLIFSFGTPLFLLTIFDLFVVWLTWQEFQKLKSRLTAA